MSSIRSLLGSWLRPVSAHADLIAAVCLAFASAAYFFGSWRYSLGVLRNPGLGFIPRIVGLLLTGCALIYLAQQLGGRKKRRCTDEQPENLDYFTAAGVAGCLLAYPFLLKWINFIGATTIVVFTMLKVLDMKGIAAPLAVALAITLPAYLLFGLVLQVVLPNGPLELLLLQFL